jgi:hypothetical protein
MNITITSANVNYQNDDVRVNFTGRDEHRSINISGHVNLSLEEYQGNEGQQALQSIIRQHVATKIMEEPSAS